MSENERIREVRKAKELTLEEFGSKIGIQRSGLSKIELGKSVVTERTRNAICSVFNVSESWLRTGEGDMFVPEPKNELDALAKRYRFRRKDYALVEKLVGLSKEERDTVFAFMMDVVAGASEGGADPDELVFPEGASDSGVSEDEIEAEADEARLLYKRERLSEKKPESPASSAKGSDVG